MATDDMDLCMQVDRLKAENARLQKELDSMRVDRDQYRRGYFELHPPVPFPTEEEMAAEMGRLVPADQVIREIRAARAKART